MLPRSRALGVNLALLGYFKYAGFFLDTPRTGSAGSFGVGEPFRHCTCCCRSGSPSTPSTRCRTRSTSSGAAIEPARESGDYAAFVSMFPHLIAGPIVRYTDIEDQLRAAAEAHVALARRSASSSSAAGSSRRCSIADSLAPHVERLFAAHAHLGFVTGWAAAPRLRAPALLRLLRLLGHGGRARAPARLPLPAELQLAVQGAEHRGLLAPLAHDAVVLASRLPVHPARRHPVRTGAHAAQPDDHRCCSADSGTARPGRSSSGGLLQGTYLSCTRVPRTPASRRRASALNRAAHVRRCRRGVRDLPGAESVGRGRRPRLDGRNARARQRSRRRRVARGDRRAAHLRQRGPEHVGGPARVATEVRGCARHRHGRGDPMVAGPTPFLYFRF